MPNVCLCLTFALADLYHLRCIALLYQLCWVFQDDKRGKQRESPSAGTGDSLCIWATLCQISSETKLDIFETWDIDRCISDQRVCRQKEGRYTDGIL
jgi:hypothetical protein